MTQATILMVAFGFLIIVGSSMGCFGTGYRPGDECVHGGCGRGMAAKRCTKDDILNLLREASRCIPRSPEGTSYSFKKIK